eukprot:6577587-Pyramimonas_sp.AAC.1
MSMTMTTQTAMFTELHSQALRAKIAISRDPRGPHADRNREIEDLGAVRTASHEVDCILAGNKDVAGAQPAEPAAQPCASRGCQC